MASYVPTVSLISSSETFVARGRLFLTQPAVAGQVAPTTEARAQTNIALVARQAILLSSANKKPAFDEVDFLFLSCWERVWVLALAGHEVLVGS